MTNIETWTLVIGAIGAAAWIPQLVRMIASLVRKQVVFLATSGQCEIGFTELGPIFNIQTVIAVNSKEILIDSIEIEIQHESGSRQKFLWHEINESKGQIVIPGTLNQPLFKEMQAIAVKVVSTDLKDILLKNRMERYTSEMRKYADKFNQERRRLIINNVYNPQAFYASAIVQDMQAYMQSQMIWKKGKYTASFVIHVSAAKPIINSPKLSFDLTDEDIVLMQSNCTSSIPALLRNVCYGDAAPQTPNEWNWLNKEINRA